MNYLTKLMIVSLLLLSVSCKKGNELNDAGGPISRYLLGKWVLVKVVTPSQTKTGVQIGYVQTIFSGNEGGKDFDRVFKDGQLIATHNWARNDMGSAATMTLVINYTDGLQRSYKILQQADSTMLQTSDYLSQIGSAQDSVVYYYKTTN